jgi:hypothetical protein
LVSADDDDNRSNELPYDNEVASKADAKEEEYEALICFKEGECYTASCNDGGEVNKEVHKLLEERDMNVGDLMCVCVNLSSG